MGIPQGVSTMGTIANLLNTLNGIGVMSLELIQNADDRSSDFIEFDLGDDALRVRNGSSFRFCGVRDGECCNVLCDWHRIAIISANAKGKHEPDSIGRFGIGFVSVYQVTDTPIIHSGSYTMTLDPTKFLTELSDSAEVYGTLFTLPYATDPTTQLRSFLGSIGTFDTSRLDEYGSIVSDAAAKSLNFLRHISRITIKRNGAIISEIKIDRTVKFKKTVTITNLSSETRKEEWLHLTSTKNIFLENAEKKHPILVNDRRKKFVEINLPIGAKSEFLTGLLYAFLPTEQTTGLPFHINGDFYPLSDRKTIHLPGVEGEFAKAAWNVAIIEGAAALITENIPLIYKEIGPRAFWTMVALANEILEDDTNLRKPFHIFWESLFREIPRHEVVLDDQEFSRVPEKVFIVKGEKLGLKREVLSMIRQPHLHTSLADYGRVIEMCGGRKLNLEALVLAARTSSAFPDQMPSVQPSEADRKATYEPLLELLDHLTVNPHDFLDLTNKLPQIKHWPIFYDENFSMTSLSRAKLLPQLVDAKVISILDSKCVALNKELRQYSNLQSAYQRYDFNDLYSSIATLVRDKVLPRQTSRNLMDSVHIAILQFQASNLLTSDDLERIRSLEIWPGSATHYYSATQCKIPGDFSDPLELAQLVDPKLVIPSALEFLSKSLLVSTLSLNTYISEILPRYFSREVNDISSESYKKLIIELWKDQPSLMLGSGLTAFKSMYFIPIGEKRFSKPENSSFFDAEIQKLLGDQTFQWVDEDMFPVGLEYKGVFLRWGVKEKPGIAEICGTWKSIVRSFSPSQAKNKIDQLVNYIFLNQRKYESGELQTQLGLMSSERCMPATRGEEYWHRPADLYLNRFEELFSSQLNAHAIGVSVVDQDKKSEFEEFLVKRLSVKFAPELQLVLEHLAWGKNQGQRPTNLLFRYLNDIAKGRGTDRDFSLLKTLRSRPVLYFNEIGYLAPQQLFKEVGSIPKPWAYPLSEKDLKSYKELWEVFMIPDQPQSVDIIEIIRSIKSQTGWANSETAASLKSAYEKCWAALNSHAELNTLGGSGINALLVDSLILTRSNEFKTSKQVFIQDSEWFEEILEDKFQSHIAVFIDSSQKLYELLELEEASTQLESTLVEVEGNRLRNFGLENKLRARAEYLQVILGPISDYPWKEVLSQVSVQSVEGLVTKWSLKTKFGSNQSATVYSMKVFLDIEASVIYVVKADSGFNLTIFFRDLLHQILPQIPEQQLRHIIGFLDNVMNKDVSEIPQLLSDSGYVIEAKSEPQEAVLANERITTPDGDDLDSGDWIKSDSPVQIVETHDVGADDLNLSSNAGPRRDISIPTASVDTPMSGVKNPYQSGVGGERSDISNSPSKDRQHSAQSEIRRVWVYVEGKSTEEGQENYSEKMELEKSSIEIVEADEWRQGRTPQIMPPRNEGFDIRSLDAENRFRFIEVKATRGVWGARGVSMSPAQLKFSIGKGNAYWVYVVEFAGSDHPRIHRIQNPALYAAGYRLNDSWREFAEMQRGESYIDDPDVLTISDAGRPFIHIQHGRGWIYNVWEGESGIFATIRYESKELPESEPLIWDSTLMHKLDI